MKKKMPTKAIITIGKDWFEANKQNFLNAANKNLDDRELNSEYKIEVDVTISDSDFVDSEYISYDTYDDEEERVHVFLDSPLEDDHKIRIAEALIKKLNKAKTLLESIK